MATMVDWSDEFSIDIQEIDEQHKRLVDLINKLFNGITSKDSTATLDAVLDELVDYTRIHFAVEECILRLFQYPGYDDHKTIHDHIVEKVLAFQRKFKAGDHKVGMELLHFLKDWLMDHINKIDRQYAPHVIKGGAKTKWLKKFF